MPKPLLLTSVINGGITDESYFGPKRIRGKRGRGAGSKTIVFGLFKRNGWVYTEIVPDVRKRTLQAVIRGKVELDSVSILMDGEAIMVLLTLGMQSIFESNMVVMNLLIMSLILMVLNRFGLMQS